MKKVSTIIMALAVILGMTQCTKPAMQLYDGSYTGVTKEITFSTGGSSKVTVDNSVLNELKFKWEEEDQLYVYGSADGDFTYGKYCGALDLVKGAGTENGFFSGTLNEVPPVGGTLRFYYSATALDGTEKSIDLSSQDGSLGYIASHLVAYADVTVMESGDYSATLAVPYSVVKLDLHEFGTTDITMTGTTNSGLTISANGVKGVTGGTSTTLSGVTSEPNAYYVAVMPESVTKLRFSGGGKVGSKTVTLSENKFETLDNTGNPVPVKIVETDEWIDFNDPAMGVEGLPIWAKKNIGATNGATAETWYGDYYAWGATTTYYVEGTGHSDPPTWKTSPKDYSGGYIPENCPFAIDFSAHEFSKYTGNDGKNTLDAADDAARAVLGGAWRMPTGGKSGEWQQLKDNTYFQWTTSYNGISGLNGYIVYKVKGSAHKGYCTYYTRSTWKTKDSYDTVVNEYEGRRNPFGYTGSDPHMFLPAVGFFWVTSLRDAGLFGHYWSSSRPSGFPIWASYVRFYSSNFEPSRSDLRATGMTVRPVQ